MYDLIIIGSGPAGSSAAIFSARAKQKVLVIDSDQSQTKSAWVENHYGVLAMTGLDLLETGKIQAKKSGAKFVEDKVINIMSHDETVKVVTESETIEAKAIILATGKVMEFAEKAGINVKETKHPRQKKIIEVDSQGRTNIPNVWAAGVCSGAFIQTIVTAGEGAKVALQIISEMKGSRYLDHDEMC